MKSLIGKILLLLAVTMTGLIDSANAAVTYVHTDHLGSVVAESNSAGQITKRFHYKPFGESIEQQQDDIGYAAHKFDTDLGLSYMEARYYDPILGRFYGNDPVGYVADNPVMSFNRFMYVNNNPYNYTDPDGEILNFIGKFVLDVGVNVALQVATGQDINIKDAVVDSAKGALDPSKTLRNMAKLGKAMSNAGEAAKRGPKTDPGAPHNAKIREVADKIVADGGTILAGGGRRPEKLVPTPGGHKEARRPDILYRDSCGTMRACNIGKTKSDGTPVTREVKAMEDLNRAGLPTTFEKYD